MKKMFVMIILMFPIVVNSQNVFKRSTNETLDLKKCVDNYCILFMNTTMSMSASLIVPDIEVNDDSEFLRFVSSTGDKIKFKSITEVLNYMFKNGWIFKDAVGQGIIGKDVQYIFEKAKQ